MTVRIPAKVEQHLRSALEGRLEELSRRIEGWLEESRERAGSLKDIIEQVRQEPLVLGPDPAVGSRTDSERSQSALGVVAEFAGQMSTSSDQAGLLGRMMDSAASLAPRAALLVVKNDSFIGWSARGMDAAFNARALRIPTASDTLLAQSLVDCATVLELHGEREGNEELTGQMGSSAPRSMMAAPLWVRDRVAALLYADSGEEEEIQSPEAIGLIATLASLALESLPMRSKHPRPRKAAPAIHSPDSRIEPSRAAAATIALDDVAGASMPQASAARSALLRTAAGEPAPGDEEIRSAHRDAQRFARLLASEILLYNEAQIEEGRLSKDLYERFKEDIERSREMYEQRVSPRLSGAADYFREELVRVLAGGDESAINLPWP